MLPYFPNPIIRLWGFEFHSFSGLIGLGIVLALRRVARVAERRGDSRADVLTAAVWAMAAGFLATAPVHRLFYANHGQVTDLSILSWLDPRQGTCSSGGVIGGVLGLLLYSRIKGRAALELADLLVQGLVVAWIFGRLGCTLAHDHLGHRTAFPLAFALPDGSRHDLGFYEFLYCTLVLFPATSFAEDRWRSRKGAVVAFVAMLYAPFRFGMDFLRSVDRADSDARHFGLTFAQYACAALFLWATSFLLVYSREIGSIVERSPRRA